MVYMPQRRAAKCTAPSAGEHACRREQLTSGPEPAHQINDQANQQDQAEPASANDGTAEIETATAEEKQKNENEKE